MMVYYEPIYEQPEFYAFIALILWSIVWKGLALWRAGKNDSKWWFIALLVINTAGILPIIYLLLDKYKKKK